MACLGHVRGARYVLVMTKHFSYISKSVRVFTVAALAVAALAVVALAACSSSTTDSVQPVNTKPVALALTWGIAKANNGVIFRATPIVTVKTAAGAEVTDAGITVNAEVASGSGRVIGNTVAVTRADGRAVFTDLGVQGYGALSIRFTAPGLTQIGRAHV